MESIFDYQALGLKCGIEIHQQLASQRKLFCRCPNRLEGTRIPEYTVKRMHRPVLGETGQFDEAMLNEFRKGMTVIYEGYYNTTCTYEIDETPPFLPNDECVDIALEIALLFKMNIIRELHIARKNYVDGSVPAGFQRTMAFGKDGELLLKTGKKIRMESLFLEEDAARKIKTVEKNIFFRVDRLGIPLIEITTAPDIHTPEEARDAAYRIGMLLRYTGKVKRVLGSIRQDINVSIRDGTRIEIKGVQRLDSIPDLVKMEVQRQVALLKIRQILQERNLKPNGIEKGNINVTDIFQNTKCKFIAESIKRGEIVSAIKIPGFKGIFGYEVQLNRRFGTEVAGKVKQITNLKGLIHSDEDINKKYSFSDEEINKIRNLLKIEKDDLFVIISGVKEQVNMAFDIVLERVRYAFKGVPPETRQAQEDCTNEFLRELHGGSRLYPDTDSIAILLSDTRIKKTSQNLGLYPWEVIDLYSDKYNIEKDIVENMIMSGNIKLFDKLITILPDNPTLIITTLNDTIRVLHREEKNIDLLEDNHYVELFNALKQNKIAKEAIISILRIWIDNPVLNFDQAKKELGIETFDNEDLDKKIRELVQKNINLINERKKGAIGPLMGDLMQVIGRGTIDGKILSQKLNSVIDNILNNQSTENIPQKSKKIGVKLTKKSKIKGDEGN